MLPRPQELLLGLASLMSPQGSTRLCQHLLQQVLQLVQLHPLFESVRDIGADTWRPTAPNRATSPAQGLARQADGDLLGCHTNYHTNISRSMQRGALAVPAAMLVGPPRRLMASL